MTCSTQFKRSSDFIQGILRHCWTGLFHLRDVHWPCLICGLVTIYHQDICGSAHISRFPHQCQELYIWFIWRWCYNSWPTYPPPKKQASSATMVGGAAGRSRGLGVATRASEEEAAFRVSWVRCMVRYPYQELLKFWSANSTVIEFPTAILSIIPGDILRVDILVKSSGLLSTVSAVVTPVASGRSIVSQSSPENKRLRTGE